MSQEPSGSQVPEEVANTTSHLLRNILLTIAGLVVLGAIGIFIYYNFINNPYLNSSNNHSVSTTTNSTTPPANTQGDWALRMTSPFSTTGPETNLTGEGRATINFSISSNHFSGTGEWTSELHGTVGPSTETSTISGSVTIDGTIENGKLSFLPVFTETTCRTEIVTVIGSQVTTDCNPNSIPDQKTIVIEPEDNATATADVAKNFGAYSYNWKENWSLSKAN